MRIRLIAASLAAVFIVASCVSDPGVIEAKYDAIELKPLPFAAHEGAAIKAFVIGKHDALRRILFIHGWAGSGAEFIDLAERLAAARPDALCICVDLPGSGSSDKPADVPYDVPYFRAAIGSIIEAARRFGLEPGAIGADLTLIGHSLGGHFCADYAANDGRGIDRLVLIAPAGCSGESGSVSLWASKNDMMLETIPEMITEETYFYSHKFVKALGADKRPEAIVRYTGKALATPEGRAALRAVSRNALERDCIDDGLGLIRVPVLLVWGKNDTMLPYRYAENFMAGLPAGARFESFDACGHMPHCDRPAELAIILSEFIGN